MSATARADGAWVRLQGSDLGFRCAPGQSLLAAGLAAGLDLPYECASGTCGSCRARLLEGRLRSRWHAASGLSERDRAKGDRILCCQSEALVDCVLQLRPGADPVHARPRRLGATVMSLRPLNDEVMHLQLQADGAPAFRAGQSMLFEWPDGIGRRAYSMANPPGCGARLEFIVKRKPGGAGSRYLFGALRAGVRLSLEGPYGRAWLRDTPAGEGLWLLAGGSGLAPVWSIAQAALAASPARPVRLYFGVQRATDLFWVAEMQHLMAAAPALQVVLVLAEPSGADPAGCRYGPVAAVLAEDLPQRVDQPLYMAGPPGLIDHAAALLVRSGRVRADRVYYDRYA